MYLLFIYIFVVYADIYAVGSIIIIINDIMNLVRLKSLYKSRLKYFYNYFYLFFF